ncbi:hypothetical protein QTG54_016101 [Skeletonema marinoi]|uniref:Uncharacterized protein n=1 Tax=Skeletonema marinoi TaxID=267567 RepID=A0AAD9D513_9STRA|nr:hypothetical protein QTG54_016101 [Skeletonema marinoi]
MSRAVICFLLAKHGKRSKDHNDTIADEVASYVFAFFEFYFQFTQDYFRASFHLNVILAPAQSLGGDRLDLDDGLDRVYGQQQRIREVYPFNLKALSTLDKVDDFLAHETQSILTTRR